jgi:N-acetylneuraminate lyase
MTEFRGVLPAVVTPFDETETFVPDVFERLLARVFDAGVHGVYVCGQTGEGLGQSIAQRKQVAEVAAHCAPKGKKVIVHVGAHRTLDAVELAQHASRIGVHAISSLPPAGGYSFAELKAYYRALASASDLPVFVYYFPELCPSLTRADEILELCAIPNVVGLKFTDFDLFKMSYISSQQAIVFNGRDEVLVAGLLMGADGGIGSFYNLVPELFLKVYDLAAAQRWREARAVQDQINELIHITLRFPVFPAIKTMLRWSGLDCGRCLAPRRPLAAHEEGQLHALLTASSLAEIFEREAVV